MNLYDHLLILQGDSCVDGVGPLGFLHPLLPGQQLHILLRQAQGGDHPQVHQPLLIKIQVTGLLHVGGSGPQSGQEAHRQGGEDQQGEEAAAGVPNLPDRVGQQAAGGFFSGHGLFSSSPFCIFSSQNRIL